MPQLVISESVTAQASARWLAGRIAQGLWTMGYFSTRDDVNRALSRDGLPAVSVQVEGREFLITVEELA